MFALYLLFIVSFFLHLPSRIPALGVVRFDLALGLFILLLLILNGSIAKLIATKDPYEVRTNRALLFLCGYIVLTIPFVEFGGSVLRASLAPFIKVVLFYVFTILLVDSGKRLRTFIVVVIGCQLFRVFEPTYLHITEGYWGSMTYAGGYLLDRLSGAPHDIINPNQLAHVILTALPFLHYLAATPGWKWKATYAVSAPVLLYALLLTSSRTGFVVFGLGYLLVLKQSKRKGLLIAVAIIGSFVAVAQMNEMQWDRVLSIFSDDARSSGTAEGRMNGITNDLKVAVRRPIVGHGLGTSGEARWNVFGNSDQISHNLYTEVLVELGLIGFIIFVSYLRSIYRNIRSSKPADLSKLTYEQALAEALWVWLMMNLLFSMALFGLSEYHWYLFGGLSLALARLRSKAEQEEATGAGGLVLAGARA